MSADAHKFTLSTFLTIYIAVIAVWLSLVNIADLSIEYATIGIFFIVLFLFLAFLKDLNKNSNDRDKHLKELKKLYDGKMQMVKKEGKKK